MTLTVSGEGSGNVAVSNGARRSYTVRNVDFRRGKDGSSKVIVSLDGEGANVAVNASTGFLGVDIFDTDLPDSLNQLVDVVDFATPVQIIDVGTMNDNVRLEMSVNGQFEHMAYQSGNDLIIEVAEVVHQAMAEEEVQFYEEREYEGTLSLIHI